LKTETRQKKIWKKQYQLLYTKLQKQYSRKINLDLKRINFALRKLGNIQSSIKNPINIIGSDGKYTTLKSLQTFIEAQGEKCSFFISPHLKSVNERIWLKDRFINIDELKKNIKIIKKLNVKLTLFEVLTMIYLISASKLKNVYCSLIEAGLLFAKDSTRLWSEPKCQIVTNINSQHLEWVKPKNLRSICKQKVGYLSKKTTIYIGKQNPKTLKIIKQILKKNPSEKNFYGKDWILKPKKRKIIYKDSKGKLILSSKKIFSEGIWQNVGLAIKVARDLKISDKNILKALPKITFEGRMQYIFKGKLRKLLKADELLLVDGCHSNASAKNLATHLKKYNNKVYGIWGIQKNRNPKEFLENFKGIYSKIVAIRIPDEPAACKPSELKRIANMMKIECEVAPNIISALKMLSSKEKKVITFFGSLYLAGKVLDIN